MGNKLRRRALMIGESDPAPLYNIDGTYTQTSGGVSTLTISNGHWHLVHSSSSTNGGVYIIPYSLVINGSRTWKAVISNFTVRSGSVGNSDISFANNYGSSQRLTYLSAGDGIHVTESNLSIATNRPFGFRIWIPSTGQYEVEFDLKVFCNDVRWY